MSVYTSRLDFIPGPPWLHNPFVVKLTWVTSDFLAQYSKKTLFAASQAINQTIYLPFVILFSWIAYSLKPHNGS